MRVLLILDQIVLAAVPLEIVLLVLDAEGVRPV